MTEGVPPTAHRRFDSLQCFRGFAAIGVLLFHCADATNHRVAPLPGWLDSLCSLGYIGVDFFFVLSGFIVLTSHLDDPKTLAAAATYVKKRVLRVFPPYLPISIGMLLMLWALPGELTQPSVGTRSDVSVLTSLLLLPTHGSPALSVAWTLVFEMVFYSVFLIFFISGRAFVAATAAWVLAILAWSPSGIPMLDTLFHPRNLEFVFGMAIAVAARVLPARMGWAVLSTGVAALGAWVLQRPAYDPVLTGAIFALIVVGGVLVESRGFLHVPALLVGLGDASYAIYLTHNPLQSGISRALSRFVPGTTWWLGMATAVVSCIAFGVLYHRRFEMPLLRWLGKRLRLKATQRTYPKPSPN